MAKTYEPIASTTLGSAASSITFSSIANTWTDLRVVFVGKLTTAGTGDNLVMRLNGDTGTNYSWTQIMGDGAASSNRATSQDSGRIGFQIANFNPSLFTVDLLSYAGSTYKTYLAEGSELGTSGGSGQYGEVTRTVGLWRSTSAINAIQIAPRYGTLGTFAAGTTATIYGIKNA